MSCAKTLTAIVLGISIAGAAAGIYNYKIRRGGEDWCRGFMQWVWPSLRKGDIRGALGISQHPGGYRYKTDGESLPNNEFNLGTFYLAKTGEFKHTIPGFTSDKTIVSIDCKYWEDNPEYQFSTSGPEPSLQNGEITFAPKSDTENKWHLEVILENKKTQHFEEYTFTLLRR